MPTATAANAARARYKSYLSARQRRGNYSMLFRDWCLALGFETAAFLGFLLGVAQSNCDVDEWLPLTRRFVLNGIGLDSDKADPLLERLARMGILKIETRPADAAKLRHVKIDVDAIDRAVQGRDS